MYEEKAIQSYMNDFNVDRETALKELEEIYEDYCRIQKEHEDELYNDFIKSAK